MRSTSHRERYGTGGVKSLRRGRLVGCSRTLIEVVGRKKLEEERVFSYQGGAKSSTKKKYFPQKESVALL